jgi:acetoin utilization deacetylase AcuC-like enzyme
MSHESVPVVWSPDTRLHEPRHEVWVGVPMSGTELPARVDAILEALTAAGHHLIEATASPEDPLRRVHTPELLEFQRTAADRWAAGEYVELAGQDRVVPYVFPTPAMSAGLPVQSATTVHAEAGRFAYDTMTLVGPGTWEAATAAASCATGAAALVADGTSLAYALCRPPGHHATPSGFGGSCYLNSAAVAAEVLRGSGHERVGIIDVDAHHGNGTSAIFYERGDVLYGSVHVDPAAGWFPHYVGHASEAGLDEGEGANRNVPLPEGTEDELWLGAVESLAEWVNAESCTALVVSLGVDAAKDDPESPLLITENGYRRAGALLRETGLPAVVVQEGGYHLPTLGALVEAYLDGHAGR